MTIAYDPAGPITDISLTPTASTITTGQDQDYTVIGYNGDGASVGDVTDQTTFTISPDGSCSGSSCTPPPAVSTQ